MNAIRFALILPACICAWILIFFAGTFTHSYIEELYCGVEALSKSECFLPIKYSFLITIIFIGLSALAVMFVAILLAPHHKLKISVIIFIAGAAVAGWMAYMSESWAYWYSAVIPSVIVIIVMKNLLSNSRDDVSEIN